MGLYVRSSYDVLPCSEFLRVSEFRLFVFASNFFDFLIMQFILFSEKNDWIESGLSGFRIYTLDTYSSSTAISKDHYVRKYVCP